MSLAVTMKSMAAAGCTPEQMAKVADDYAHAEDEKAALRRANAARRQREFRAREKIAAADDENNALPASPGVTERDNALPASSTDDAYRDNHTRAPVFPVGISNDIPPIDSPLPSEGHPQAIYELDQARVGSSSGKKSSKPKEPSPQEILSEILSEKTAADVIAHRKALRKPLTHRAAELLAKTLAASGDAERAAATMIERGWQGYRLDWDTPNARAGPGRPQQKRNPFFQAYEELMDEYNGRNQPPSPEDFGQETIELSPSKIVDGS